MWVSSTRPFSKWTRRCLPCAPTSVMRSPARGCGRGARGASNRRSNAPSSAGRKRSATRWMVSPSGTPEDYDRPRLTRLSRQASPEPLASRPPLCLLSGSAREPASDHRHDGGSGGRCHSSPTAGSTIVSSEQDRRILLDGRVDMGGTPTAVRRARRRRILTIAALIAALMAGLLSTQAAAVAAAVPAGSNPQGHVDAATSPDAGTRTSRGLGVRRRRLDDRGIDPRLRRRAGRFERRRGPRPRSGHHASPRCEPDLSGCRERSRVRRGVHHQPNGHPDDLRVRGERGRDRRPQRSSRRPVGLDRRPEPAGHRRFSRVAGGGPAAGARLGIRPQRCRHTDRHSGLRRWAGGHGRSRGSRSRCGRPQTR